MAEDTCMDNSSIRVSHDKAKQMGPLTLNARRYPDCRINAYIQRGRVALKHMFMSDCIFTMSECISQISGFYFRNKNSLSLLRASGRSASARQLCPTSCTHPDPQAVLYIPSTHDFSYSNFFADFAMNTRDEVGDFSRNDSEATSLSSTKHPLEYDESKAKRHLKGWIASAFTRFVPTHRS